MKKLVLLLTAMLALLSLGQAEEYAKIQRSDMSIKRIIRTDGPVAPSRFEREQDGGDFFWVPVVRDERPPFDPDTQKLRGGIVVSTNQVQFRWQVVALSQEEQDERAEEAERISTVAELRTLHAKCEDGTITPLEMRRALELVIEHLRVR